MKNGAETRVPLRKKPLRRKEGQALPAVTGALCSLCAAASRFPAFGSAAAQTRHELPRGLAPPLGLRGVKGEHAVFLKKHIRFRRVCRQRLARHGAGAAVLVLEHRKRHLKAVDRHILLHRHSLPSVDPRSVVTEMPPSVATVKTIVPHSSLR